MKRISLLLCLVVVGWRMEEVGAMEEVVPADRITESLFGTPSTTNHLRCVYYDFSRRRNGATSGVPADELIDGVVEFLQSDWKRSRLARYYRSPLRRDATSILVPPIHPILVGAVFGEGRAVQGEAPIVVTYAGRLTHEGESITFRFMGAADDLLAVRVGGGIVLIAGEADGRSKRLGAIWRSSDELSGKRLAAGRELVIGDWITLKPNETVDFNAMIMDAEGGAFSAMLMVEVKGATPALNARGAIRYAPFLMTPLSEDARDAMIRGVSLDEVNLDAAPLFGTAVAEADNDNEEKKAFAYNVISWNQPRAWTADDGRVVEASLASMKNDDVVLKRLNGKRVNVPLNRLSRADQSFIGRAMLDFKFSVSRELLKKVGINWRTGKYHHREYQFVVEVDQTGFGAAAYDLSLEFYVLARERHGGNHILVAVAREEFVSTRQKYKKFTDPVSMTSEQFPLRDDEMTNKPRGDNEFIHLITVTDKERGVVRYSASEEWLIAALGNLRGIPVGATVNKLGERVVPATVPYPKQ